MRSAFATTHRERTRLEVSADGFKAAFVGLIPAAPDLCAESMPKWHALTRIRTSGLPRAWLLKKEVDPPRQTKRRA
jgi:hypothetical protein